MRRILLILLFFAKMTNAQQIKEPENILLAVSDSGGLEINGFNVSNTDITLKTLDSIFQAKHYRSSLTRNGLAYFTYPKYRLRVLCFVGMHQSYPALIFLPLRSKKHPDITLMVNDIAFSNNLSFDEIYYNSSFQSIIQKRYYEDPAQPNKDVMVLRNINNVCLELRFDKSYLDAVVINVNSALND